MTAAARAGERIRKARKAKGWDLRQVGEATGLDFGFVGKVERGALASVPVYERLAAAVGLTLDALFDEQDTPSTNQGSVVATHPRKVSAGGGAVRRRTGGPSRRSSEGSHQR